MLTMMLFYKFLQKHMRNVKFGSTICLLPRLIPREGSPFALGYQFAFCLAVECVLLFVDRQLQAFASCLIYGI